MLSPSSLHGLQDWQWTPRENPRLDLLGALRVWGGAHVSSHISTEHRWSPQHGAYRAEGENPKRATLQGMPNPNPALRTDDSEAVFGQVLMHSPTLGLQQ